METQHRLLSAAYRAQRSALFVPAVATQALVARLRRLPPPKPEAIAEVRARFFELWATDLANVERGYYPASLLFDTAVARHAARALPGWLADLPRVVLRMARKNYRDLPESARPERYPAYYRRNFHWQTDGYLSRRSARLYDVAVEFLFLGVADVMRRQVIPPMARYAAAQPDPDRPLRVLDVACGTGRSLAQLARAFPRWELTGVDLSYYYVDRARETLPPDARVRLLTANAEQLPLPDHHFDIVTSTFLFHELPRRARRGVLAEMARVLAPGGLMVVADSVQLSDSGPIAALLEAFARDFHEPYYRDYLKDDLATLLADCGIAHPETSIAYLTKVIAGTSVRSGDTQTRT